MAEIAPRLSTGDIRRIAPADERMTARHWRNLDRAVTAELDAVDRGLAAWVRFEPKGAGMDQLLDERLMLRPPDVMATWPVRRRSS